MDEDEVKEIEAEETQEEETGGEATTEEVEQEQAVEEHDWGALEERLNRIEEGLQSLTEAFATLSIEKEEPESDPEPEYGEDGEAIDLGELENMLGS